MEPTVLVVEDEPDIVALLLDFLAVEGFGVLTAGDASTALAALAGRRVDCVLVDVMLPGSSGFDLCRRIREDSDVPLLFLTARGDDSDKLRGLGLGADDYIVKSATPAEVVARVKAVLRRAPRNGNGAARRTLRFGDLAIDLGAHEVALGTAADHATPSLPRSQGRQPGLTPSKLHTEKQLSLVDCVVRWSAPTTRRATARSRAP